MADYQKHAGPDGVVRSATRLVDTVNFLIPRPGEPEAVYLGSQDYQRYKADILAGAQVLDPVLSPAKKSAVLEVSVEDVRTPNATIATLASWPLAVQTLYTARFTILAIDTGNGDCRVWHATATAKRLNNGASLVGTPTVLSVHGDAGSASWALAADANGNNFRVRVTGAAGRTISWSLVGEVIRARPDGLVD